MPRCQGWSPPSSLGRKILPAPWLQLGRFPAMPTAQGDTEGEHGTPAAALERFLCGERFLQSRITPRALKRHAEGRQGGAAACHCQWLQPQDSLVLLLAEPRGSGHLWLPPHTLEQHQVNGDLPQGWGGHLVSPQGPTCAKLREFSSCWEKTPTFQRAGMDPGENRGRRADGLHTSAGLKSPLQVHPSQAASRPLRHRQPPKMACRWLSSSSFPPSHTALLCRERKV